MVCVGLLLFLMIPYTHGEEPDDKTSPKSRVQASWPQFMGPDRDGVVKNSPPLLDKWPEAGPKQLWKSEELPEGPRTGVGSPVVADGKVFCYAHIALPMEGMFPFNMAFLKSQGYAAGMSPELGKKIDQACRSKERGSLRSSADIDSYAGKFIAGLSPEEQRKFSEAIRIRIKIGKKHMGTGGLNWMASQEKKEVKTQQDFKAMFDGKFGHHMYHGGWAGRITKHADAFYKDAKYADRLYCLDAATGKKLWASDLPGAKKQYGVSFGCSGTPSIAEDKAYLRGSGGLFCLDIKNKGKMLWHVQAGPGNGSPILHKGVLYCHLNALSAVDAKTGKELWRQKKVSHEHQTPEIWEHKGKAYVLAMGRGGIHCVDAGTGKIIWAYKHIKRKDSPSLLATGDTLVYRSGSPGGANMAFKLSLEKLEPLWPQTTKGAGDHGGSSPVVYQGHAYFAGEGYGRRLVMVVNLQTGKATLDKKGVKGEGTTPIVVDGKVIASANGNYKTCNVIAYQANPNKYEQIGMIKQRMVACSSPALADGKLFFRAPKAIMCYDLRK